MEDLNKYIRVVPSEVQKNIQEMEFYIFIHFGMNTFLGKEWSNGTGKVEKFNPTKLNTDDWCNEAKKVGAKGIILTAKHHDGFCLWQTKTTEYSIKNSPYKKGKGDIVKELSESCKKYGIKMGLYLSPWDRNSKYYGTKEYDDFYIAQLTELLTNYGDVFTVWLDGACGAGLDGKSRQDYDFKRYYEKIRELQPNCAISNCGPDVRWVGNEAGKSRESEWSVVPKACFNEVSIMDNSQKQDKKFTGNIDQCSKDIGSREVLKNFDEFVWYPAEVDVSIRPGWFYHKLQDFQVKKTDKLMNIYYNSVGNNCTLLLNIPPDKTGLINKADKKALQKFKEAIDNAFYQKININKLTQNELIYRYEFNESFIDKVVIQEDIDYSQRIEKFEISTMLNDKEVTLFKGTIVGYKKICLFDSPIKTNNLLLKILYSRKEPHIKTFDIYMSK